MFVQTLRGATYVFHVSLATIQRQVVILINLCIILKLDKTFTFPLYKIIVN